MIEQTITVVIAVLISVWLVIWGLQSWGRRNAERARKYDFLSKYVEGHIESMNVNDHNFNLLRSHLKRLDVLTHRHDREQTQVLWTNFYRKFGKIYGKRLLKDMEKRKC